MDNAWVGQQNGNAAIGLSPISPYLFGQRKLLNIYFLPKLRDLPQSDLLFYKTVFDFGFTPGTNGLSALGTENVVIQIQQPTLIYAVQGVSDEPAVPQLGFLFQLFHTHEGKQRRWFNRHVANTEFCGTGKRPMILRTPYLFLQGDSIECEVKNLAQPAAPNVTRIQVALIGAQLIPGAGQ